MLHWQPCTNTMACTCRGFSPQCSATCQHEHIITYLFPILYPHLQLLLAGGRKQSLTEVDNSTHHLYRKQAQHSYNNKLAHRFRHIPPHTLATSHLITSPYKHVHMQTTALLHVHYTPHFTTARHILVASLNPITAHHSNTQCPPAF